MDAATLRIVLIILGALFLTGLYLWERRRVRAARNPVRERRPYRGREAKREPNLGAFDAEDRSEAPSAVAAETASSAVVDAPGMAGTWHTASFRTQGDRAVSGEGVEGDAAEETNALIVQFYVVAREGSFSGQQIDAAAQRHNLVPGDMAIFHRRKVEGAARSAPFSMANAFNPGTFPFDAMDDFSTQGLVLFAQLDGAPSDLMVFDELVQTATALARELDGELLDNSHTRLGVEHVNKLRGEVLDLLDGMAGSERA